MLSAAAAIDHSSVSTQKQGHTFPVHLLSLAVQGKWVAQVLAGRSQLPSPEQMLAECRAFEERFLAAGVPLRYLHCQARFSQCLPRFRQPAFETRGARGEVSGQSGSRR